MCDYFLAEVVEGNEVPITPQYACSDVIHLSCFLFVKKPLETQRTQPYSMMIVSGKCFLILLLLMNAATVTTEAEK